MIVTIFRLLCLELALGMPGNNNARHGVKRRHYLQPTSISSDQAEWSPHAHKKKRTRRDSDPIMFEVITLTGQLTDLSGYEAAEKDDDIIGDSGSEECGLPDFVMQVFEGNWG